MNDANDRELLIRDKYEGDANADHAEDLARLAAGEPLAYVIGWMPFLGLRIGLDSRPLIPRPETEWWTELLVARLKQRFGDAPFEFLDLCAGSGAIGLAVLLNLPAARVSFGELEGEHVALIRKNLEENGLDASRAELYESDLFDGFPDQRFDVIATNPPYVPAHRALEESVTAFEPAEALYAGADGLDLIRRIALEASSRLRPSGELWMECDIANIDEAAMLLMDAGADRTEIRTDLYSRPRIVVGYYA
jgi:release factor glutamine methyltransferase